MPLPQHMFRRRHRKSRTPDKPPKLETVRVVNLEKGLPTVTTALDLLEWEMAEARAGGFHGLKLIHGYGSTGVGGDIKAAVHGRLAEMKKLHLIKGFVPGEQWDVFEPPTRQVLDDCGELGKDPDCKYNNEGVTLVLL